MILRIGKRYVVNPSRMGFKYYGVGEKQNPLHRLPISQDGVVEIPLWTNGPVPGSKLSLRVLFRSAHSGQFARMCNGTVLFLLENNEVALYCYPRDGKKYRIVLPIIQ